MANELSDWPVPQKRKKEWVGLFPYSIAAFIVVAIIFIWRSNPERFESTLERATQMAAQLLGLF